MAKGDVDSVDKCLRLQVIGWTLLGGTLFLEVPLPVERPRYILTCLTSLALSLLLLEITSQIKKLRSSYLYLSCHCTSPCPIIS